MIKSFLISLVSFIVLDFLWLGFVVKKFNTEQLKDLGRFKDGDIQVLYTPAFIVYVLMAVGITFFVLPKLTDDSSWLSVFLGGALMGLIVYGVYDMTNLSIIKDYPIPFALADIAWGTFVFGVVTAIAWKLSSFSR